MVTDAFHAVPVVDCTAAGARQVVLRVDAKGAVAAGHTTPGQYVKVTLPFDEVPRTYAIASAPGHDTIELLLKVPDERITQLLALGPGDKLAMSRPQGKGYPVDRVGGHHLWLFAVGSGIAPLRAVLDHLLPRRNDLLDIKLLYGVREAAELSFTQRFDAWAGHGIQVMPVVSRALPGSWNGRTGHVQEHVPKVLPDPARTLAFICGLPAMDRDVCAQLLQRGVGAEQVFRNW